MKTVKKRLSSILLVFAMLVSLLAVPVSAEEADSTETVRYTVLILDTSGSMKGTPATVQKEAATLFCEYLLDSDETDYIAIVQLNTSSTTSCSFTSDLDTLISVINNLGANGGTNINQALTIAQNLLNAVSDDTGAVIKNIVLCSDGLPESGSTTTSGPYTSSDSSNNYKYANAVYSTSETIRESDINLYSLGFFHSLSGSTLTFAQTFMADIATSEDYYYEVTDAEDILYVFEQIATDAAADVVTNSINGTENNYDSGLTVDETEYFRLNEDNNSFSHSTSSFFDGYYSNGSYVSTEKEKYLISDEYFSALLDLADSTWEKICLYVQRGTKAWSGSCFGLAVSMSLASVETDSIEYLSDITDTNNGIFYGLVPKDTTTSNLRDVINYFQLYQNVEDADVEINTETNGIYDGSSLEEFLEELVKYAKESEKNEEPVLLCYDFDESKYLSDEESKYLQELYKAAGFTYEPTGAHGVVICGYEYALNSDGTYEHRITIYDMNDTDSYYTMYIAEDYSSFDYQDCNMKLISGYLETAGLATSDKIRLEHIWTSMRIYSFDWMVEAENNRPDSPTASAAATSSANSLYAASAETAEEETVTLSISAYKTFTMTNAEGEILYYDGSAYGGDMDVYSLNASNESDLSFTLTIKASESFLLTDFEDDFEITVLINDVYYTASASGADSILLSATDGIIIYGDSSYTFTAGCSVEMENSELLRVSGTTTGSCTFTISDSGAILSSENGCSEVLIESYYDVNYESTCISQTIQTIEIYDGEESSVAYQFTDSSGTVFTISASGTCSDNDLISWVLTSDGTLTISGSGDMTDYTRVDSAPWYEYRNSITTVVIESGVTSIGSYAFYNCSALTEVSIPNTVTSIGSSAFRSCSSLTAIAIPEGVTAIGSYAFTDCTALTTAELPEGLTAIKNYMFYGCINLHDITIPNSVSSIGWCAFYDCRSLTEVTIPDGIERINSRAFYGCTELTIIAVPASVTSIGSNAFCICTSLAEIWFEGDAPEISSSAFSDVTATAYYHYDPEIWTSDVMQDYGGSITWIPYFQLVLNDGEEELAVLKVFEGDIVELASLSEPIQTGYTFAGWIDADGNAVTEDITVTDDIVLYASWTADNIKQLAEDVTAALSEDESTIVISGIPEDSENVTVTLTYTDSSDSDTVVTVETTYAYGILTPAEELTAATTYEITITSDNYTFETLSVTTAEGTEDTSTTGKYNQTFDLEPGVDGLISGGTSDGSDSTGSTDDSSSDTDSSDTNSSDTGGTNTDDSSSNTGTSDNGNTDNGIDDTDNTGTGSSDTDSSDMGSGDKESSDTGNSEADSSDTGNSDTDNSGTGNSDTGSGNSDKENTGNTDSGSTDSGNADTDSTDETDTFTGVRKLSDGNWYYVENDDNVIDYTGLVRNDGTYGTAGWYYVVNGKVDFAYTGLVKHDATTGGKAGWYYVKNGYVNFAKTGLVYNPGTVYGVKGWFYVKNAYVDFSFSSLVKHTDGNWYAVKNGYVDFSVTGLVKNDGTYGIAGWYYVENAVLKFSYSGLTSNTYGSWYVKNGYVDFTYSGPYVYNTVIFTIKNGQVVA